MAGLQGNGSKIRIHVLGAQSVQMADGTEVLSVSAQPKRLALLAYLAMSATTGDGYVSRDKLLALFWPESDNERARNALNQYVFRLRESLGSDTILSRGAGRLGLNRDLVWCDAIRFLAALEGSDLEGALDLYHGDFLSGFHLSGTPELEKWLDNRRRLLRSRALDAALALGKAADDAGEWAEAAGWYRRAIRVDPDSTLAAQGFELATSKAERSSMPAPGVPATAGAPATAGTHANGGAGSRASWNRAAWRIAAVVVVAGWWTSGVRSRTPDPLPRVAVLPFEDVLGDSSLAYLVDGLHAEVSAAASRTDGLVVLSRRAVMRYRDSDLGLAEIALELDADAILEASMVRRADSVRVHMRLLDPATGRTLWSQPFDEAMSDVVSLVGRLPAVVATELQRVLSPGADPPRGVAHVVNPAAHDAYLRGAFLRRNEGAAGDSSAADYFNLALEIDSSHAGAWAERGNDLVDRGAWFGDLTPAFAMPKARTDFEHALRLDSTLATAHLGLARVNYLFDWRWTEAEQYFENALRLDPNSEKTLVHYANFLRAMLRIDEGVGYMESALALNPLDEGLWAEISTFYTHLGRTDDSRRAVARAVELGPEFPWTRFVLALQQFGTGEHEEAARVMAEIRFLGFAARIHAADGREDEARAILTTMESSPKPNSVAVAGTHYFLGEVETALDWLERGLETRDSNMIWLNSAAHASQVYGYEPLAVGWPELGANLVALPRFQAVLAEMAFPER